MLLMFDQILQLSWEQKCKSYRHMNHTKSSEFKEIIFPLPLFLPSCSLSLHSCGVPSPLPSLPRPHHSSQLFPPLIPDELLVLLPGGVPADRQQSAHLRGGRKVVTYTSQLSRCGSGSCGSGLCVSLIPSLHPSFGLCNETWVQY